MPLSINDIVHAEVVRIEPYGIFLEFGGARILVLITDIQEAPIRDLASLYRVGERVAVRILFYVDGQSVFKGTIKACEHERPSPS